MKRYRLKKRKISIVPRRPVSMDLGDTSPPPSIPTRKKVEDLDDPGYRSVVIVSVTGLVAVAVVALGLVWLFLRKKDGTLEPLPMPAAALPAPGGGLGSPQQFPSPSMRTYALPGLSDLTTSGLLVARAFPDGQTEVGIRCVGPSGQWAAVGSDPIAVAQSSMTSPSGDVFVLAAGEETTRVRLRPGQSLYAKGSTVDVKLATHTYKV